jgi:7,8-dihydropterin-6-yl-methyl-4-(beta-D-ribofuranosyl)aminobenzene 5'-phosphate synthase
MNIKILYDNRAEQGFMAGWGFSCLVEAEKPVLFDVGWDPEVLLHNMRQFNIDVDDIDSIVLSHAHWDHIGALPAVLSDEKTVYVPASFSKNLKREISQRAAVVEVSGATQITEHVSTTGELGSSIKEQSLRVDCSTASYILTGCAHPGLESIIKACNVHRFGVIGGFHGFSQFEILEDALMVCPCHCTHHMKELEDIYPHTYRYCAAGCSIPIGDHR